MTPSVNFICPCCLHKGRLTDELFDTIMQVVSEDYGSDRHNIEWASTIRIAQVADLYEEDPGFARRLDLIVEKCREKILNNSQPHAISA
jgi:hypothetical protein